MGLFADEAALQKWLKEKFESGLAFFDLIVNADGFKNDPIAKPESLILTRIRESYLFCMSSFDINELLFANENISLNTKDILKPDLVLYAAETQSIVIVELKNIKASTRQAGTEVGAYAAEIKSYLPFLADGEVINVIISAEWPALLRHYVTNEIMWLNRKMICLEAIEHEGEILLGIVPPSVIADGNLRFSVSGQQLGGFHLSLYDHEAKMQVIILECPAMKTRFLQHFRQWLQKATR